MSLEPIEPERALELYLADRENNVTHATIYSHRSRLGHFIRWCANEEITNLNGIAIELEDGTLSMQIKRQERMADRFTRLVEEM